MLKCLLYMSNEQDQSAETQRIKQLQRALYYESQFRNAIVSDAVCFYDVNITRDLIETDFFFRDDKKNFISVPDYVGINTPCRFTDFINKWAEIMIPDLSQKTLTNISVLREKLLSVYSEGKREYTLNYWGEDVTGKKIYFNQRFLLTQNEFNEICALSIIKDYTQVKEFDDEYLTSELEKIAYEDPITNGINYFKFKEKVIEEGKPGSIICLDIHSFKVINSICGITRGDDVIKAIWEAIRIAIDSSKGEFAAHINADHYIIFIPTENKDDIIARMKSITLTLMVISVDLDVPQLQPYFGVSYWKPAKKIELAYSEAVTAKHNAKYSQKQNYDFFSIEDTKRLVKEKEMMDSFEESLAKKEFKIWFQPKYTPKTRYLEGAEALVRWVKPDGTVIPPSEFIPLFERNNMIRNLDEYIFRNVCMLQKKWLDEGKNIVPVSVNLSRVSLYYKNVAEQYKKITEIIKIDPKYVPIEITETAAITNEDVSVLADSFHKNGFSLIMDDFGSGYSSLASLNLMHFDTLKLDKSLVDYIGNYSGNRLIEHTIALAKELGIKITAEGVETENQVQFLKRIGCDNIQGFFYSKPVSAEAYSKVLNNQQFGGELKPLDYIEEHLYEFNASLVRTELYSLVVNLTKNIVLDYTERDDWKTETGIFENDYDIAVERIKNELISEEYKEEFYEFMERHNLLKNFNSTNETRVFEYKRLVHNELMRMRIILNLFKIPQTGDDKYAYIKVYNLN